MRSSVLTLSHPACLVRLTLYLNASMSSSGSSSSGPLVPPPVPRFRGLKVRRPRVDSRSCLWKTHPASLRRGADLETFPEGDLFKRQRGATFGPPLLLTTMASSSFPGAASSPFDPLHAIEELAAISIRSRSSSGQPQQLHSRFFANPHFLQNQCEGAPRRTGMEKPEPWLLNPNARGGTLRQSRALRSHCDV
jgi:hypothetical protein